MASGHQNVLVVREEDGAVPEPLAGHWGTPPDRPGSPVGMNDQRSALMSVKTPCKIIFIFLSGTVLPILLSVRSKLVNSNIG